MTTIQGLAAYAAGAQLLSFKYDAGDLRPNEVEIRISHCGVCHSDIHLVDNDWGVSQYPFIPGHEVVGTITAIGSTVAGRTVGQRVGVGWQSGSCGSCEWCLKGEENLCPKEEATCVQRHGGFADAIRVDARFAIPVPDALESENAAPLLCGGITVYNPIRSLGVNPASRVGVVGIGGLGHMAVQFARVFGAEVTAFSTSPDKEKEVRGLGAHHFVNSRDTSAVKKLAGSLDLILTTINQDQDWPQLLTALRPHGTLCFVGVPPTPATLPVFPLIAGMKRVAGSKTGSPHQIAEMLDVAARHGVKAMTERFPMAKANEAVAKVKKNHVRYRAVLAN